MIERPSKIQKKKLVVISFTEEEAAEVAQPHDDAIFVTMMVSNFNIYQMLVDNWSSTDIMYRSTFEKTEDRKEKSKPIFSPIDKVC
jgi:hypothetical protein